MAEAIRTPKKSLKDKSKLKFPDKSFSNLSNQEKDELLYVLAVQAGLIEEENG